MSSKYLLDTSVLSVFGPHRTKSSDELDSWLVVTLPRLHVSVVTIYEIEQGSRKLRRTGAASRAEAIDAWLEALLVQFQSRILDVDVDIAREAGRLSDWAFEHGVHPGTADIMIAATAIVHDLALLTYNMKHFGPLEIGAVDPSVRLPR